MRKGLMMKIFKDVVLVLAVVSIAATVGNAASIVSYTASDSPGAAPDGNGNTVDVWTVTGDGGSGRSYLKDPQDGNQKMWAIWDLSDGAGTYATHNFEGGALTEGQTVSIDYTHNINIDDGRHIGIRLLDGDNSEVEFVFEGGKFYYSKYDTGTGVYELTDKQYDNYDIFQVAFTLTGSNSYEMSVTEGSIMDEGYKPHEDGDPAVGDVVDSWTGSFTGNSITGIQVFTEGGNESDQWFDNMAVTPEPSTVVMMGIGSLLLRRKRSKKA